MNAVEIEEAVSQLADKEFDREAFPFEFLRAFGNNDTTIKRIKKGNSNKSDIDGGVLQYNNIHIVVCEKGLTHDTLLALKESPATTRQRAKIVLATDGEWFEAENLQDVSQAPISCAYHDFPDHFGYFLPLAGISIVRQISDNAFDIRATARLNKLYVELLQLNPEWGTADRREEMNHFVARLIFCFFAEDTGIFSDKDLFTGTISQMSDRTGENTHEVLGEVFRAMKVAPVDRANANLPRWADHFPYVNGGMFSGGIEAPKFNRIARSYLINIGDLDWTRVNPDIFGSMIQAVADDEERGELGMHYTSVPNILKVLNPLFLDDLNQELEEAGDNARTLLNLRRRIANIRVFDPACGSGNFLVIAYKKLREIEHTINQRRGEATLKSEINIANFKGIELRGFSCEIARLALVIAEYQCDVSYRGRELALNEFLPLQEKNWIVQGNALRLDWEGICSPIGREEEPAAEIYICGNPPYIGSKRQNQHQKDDMEAVFSQKVKNFKSLDYVSGWFMKAADLSTEDSSRIDIAFVATNSVCQGTQAGTLWPAIFSTGYTIGFAHTSFKWSNLASHNAGVTVVVVGLTKLSAANRMIFSIPTDGNNHTLGKRDVKNINGYLIDGPNILVKAKSSPYQGIPAMHFGNHPYYGGGLIFSNEEKKHAIEEDAGVSKYIRKYYGSKEFANSCPRFCLWITDNQSQEAIQIPFVANKIKDVRAKRLAATKDNTAQKLSNFPWRFREQISPASWTIIIPRISSENRDYLPVGLLDKDCVVQEKAFALYDAPLWTLSLIASRLHWVWIGAVCVRLEMRFSYSNTLGWNTFPVPKLTEQDKVDLTRCAENILLTRERHFPATIADLYDPDNMPSDLKAAHEQNDETLERIYIGRRFRNDTERLEKLFDMYAKKTAGDKK